MDVYGIYNELVTANLNQLISWGPHIVLIGGIPTLKNDGVRQIGSSSQLWK